MSQTRKDFKRSLKGPDVLQRNFLRTSRWIDRNQTSIFIGIGIVVVLFIVGLMGAFYYKQTTNKTMMELAKIDLKQQEALLSWSNYLQDTQKKLIEIQTKIDDPKTSANDKKELLVQKNLLEKKLKEEPNTNAFAGEYQKFYEANKTNPSGWIAGLRAANSLIEKNNFKDAKDILTVIVENGRSHDFYNIQVRLMLVGLLEQLNEYDTALNVLAPIEKNSGKEIQPLVLLTKGRLLLYKKDNAKAKVELEKLINAYSEADEAKTARGLIALM